MPASMVKGDTLAIPVYVYNNMKTSVTVPISIANPNSLTYLMTLELPIVQPHSNLVKYISIGAEQV
jgi:hypothetical protein